MLDAFKRDFRERFLNFETAKGIYLVPAGVIIVGVTILHMRFLIQAAGVLLGVYMVSEGLRKIFVNRVKQAAKVGEMVEAHLEAKAGPADPQF